MGRPSGDRFDFLIPVFLIVVPSLLRQRVPWGSRGPAMQALLTAWFAIFAAAATVGLVSMLHFVEGGQLADGPKDATRHAGGDREVSRPHDNHRGNSSDFRLSCPFLIIASSLDTLEFPQ